jgi:hypothetical protein
MSMNILKNEMDVEQMSKEYEEVQVQLPNPEKRESDLRFFSETNLLWPLAGLFKFFFSLVCFYNICVENFSLLSELFSQYSYFMSILSSCF